MKPMSKDEPARIAPNTAGPVEPCDRGSGSNRTTPADFQEHPTFAMARRPENERPEKRRSGGAGNGGSAEHPTAGVKGQGLPSGNAADRFSQFDLHHVTGHRTHSGRNLGTVRTDLNPDLVTHRWNRAAPSGSAPDDPGDLQFGQRPDNDGVRNRFDRKHVPRLAVRRRASNGQSLALADSEPVAPVCSPSTSPAVSTTWPGRSPSRLANQP